MTMILKMVIIWSFIIKWLRRSPGRLKVPVRADEVLNIKNNRKHEQKSKLVNNRCRSSIVSTVAILAQGTHRVMRSRNPFYVFSRGFESCWWFLFILFLWRKNMGRCCQNLAPGWVSILWGFEDLSLFSSFPFTLSIFYFFPLRCCSWRRVWTLGWYGAFLYSSLAAAARPARTSRLSSCACPYAFAPVNIGGSPRASYIPSGMKS